MGSVSQLASQTFFRPDLLDWSWPIFDRFLPKGGQMLFDVNSEPRFEILSSFAAYIIPFC